MTDILNIIKIAPADHIYWCTLCGPCKVKINELEDFPITVIGTKIGRTVELTSHGEYVTDYSSMKCVLFPCRESRNWDSFKEDVMTGILSRDSAKCDNSEFDIVKAKNGAPVKTKAGYNARIICYDCTGSYYPIIALVKKNNSKTELICEYNADGTCYNDLNGFDLTMVPSHCEGDVTIRQDKLENIQLDDMDPTQEEAKNNAIFTQYCIELN